MNARSRSRRVNGSALNAASSLMLALFCMLNASHASAGCSDRPGTPNEVKTSRVTLNSIAFGWKNATRDSFNPFGEHTMYFDIYARDGSRKNIGRDLTGIGPYKVYNGKDMSYEFKNLSPNTTYCFSIRARTEGGTQGCISERNSAWVCAVTAAEMSVTTPPSTAPASPAQFKVLGRHRQVATAKNDVDIYDGPGGQFKVVGILRSGAQGTVRGKQEGWYKLEAGVPGGLGWVAEDHLTVQTFMPGGMKN